MKRELRSNKVMNFMRRSHWLTLGLSDEDMEKPKIAVVNSSSEIAVCFSHLDEIAKKAKDASALPAGWHSRCVQWLQAMPSWVRATADTSNPAGTLL